MGRPILILVFKLALRVHQPEKKYKYISRSFLHSWEEIGKKLVYESQI